MLKSLICYGGLTILKVFCHGKLNTGIRHTSYHLGSNKKVDFLCALNSILLELSRMTNLHCFLLCCLPLLQSFLPVSFFLLCPDQNSLTVVMSIWIKRIHWNQILISPAITHLLGIEIGCHSLVAKCPNLFWKMLVHSVHKSRGSITKRAEITWPTALTPLSVLAAHIQSTFLKSPKLHGAMACARKSACSNSPSIVIAPGFLCMPR